MYIQKAQLHEAPTAAQLALRLWPNNELSQFIADMNKFISSEHCAIFLAYEQHTAIGFAQCQLRTDYVEGTDSSPVGYLEGLYVCEAYRQQHIAKQLVAACEQWAITNGCVEFASDCELTNEASIHMHAKLGFHEVNRIVCFTKKLS